MSSKDICWDIYRKLKQENPDKESDLFHIYHIIYSDVLNGIVKESDVTEETFKEELKKLNEKEKSSEKSEKQEEKVEEKPKESKKVVKEKEYEFTVYYTPSEFAQITKDNSKPLHTPIGDVWYPGVSMDGEVTGFLRDPITGRGRLVRGKVKPPKNIAEEFAKDPDVAGEKDNANASIGDLEKNKTIGDNDKNNETK